MSLLSLGCFVKWQNTIDLLNGLKGCIQCLNNNTFECDPFTPMRPKSGQNPLLKKLKGSPLSQTIIEAAKCPL